MKFKLYTAFAFVAIVSALVSLVRIALGHNIQDVLPLNMVIGSVCITCIIILVYKERRKTIG